MIDLDRRWNTLRKEQPGLRARDGARQLGVTEAELVASHPAAIRLDPDPGALLRGLAAVGEVMITTRNPAAVMEHTGRIERVEVGAPAGGVYGADIELRFFPTRWAAAWAVPVLSRRGELRSIQVFDAEGVAVVKAYALAGTDDAAFADLLTARTAQLPDFDPISPTVEIPAAPADPAGLLADWAALQDTHAFHGMLRKHRCAREAYRAAEGRFTRQLPTDAVERVLRAVAEGGYPLFAFVASAGCTQIHHAPIRRVALAGTWLNVLDEAFNLHVQLADVVRVWEVTKPTRGGPVRSIELEDARGEAAVILFGPRSDGAPDDPRWLAVLDAL